MYIGKNGKRVVSHFWRENGVIPVISKYRHRPNADGQPLMIVTYVKSTAYPDEYALTLDEAWQHQQNELKKLKQRDINESVTNNNNK